MNRREIIQAITAAIAGAATMTLDQFAGVDLPVLPLQIPYKIGPALKSSKGFTVDLSVDTAAFQHGLKQLQAAIRRGRITPPELQEKLETGQLFRLVRLPS